MGAQHVGAVMEPLPSPLPATTALADAADLLSLSGHGALPVIDDTGEYVGVVTGQAVAEALAEQPDAAPGSRTARRAPPRPVTPDEPLAQALHALLSATGTGIPVLDPEQGKPVGWLSHQSALRAVYATT
jgi:CIC family chloride channel protein